MNNREPKFTIDPIRATRQIYHGMAERELLGKPQTSEEQHVLSRAAREIRLGIVSLVGQLGIIAGTAFAGFGIQRFGSRFASTREKPVEQVPYAPQKDAMEQLRTLTGMQELIQLERGWNDVLLGSLNLFKEEDRIYANDILNRWERSRTPKIAVRTGGIAFETLETALPGDSTHEWFRQYNFTYYNPGTRTVYLGKAPDRKLSNRFPQAFILKAEEAIDGWIAIHDAIMPDADFKKCLPAPAAKMLESYRDHIGEDWRQEGSSVQMTLSTLIPWAEAAIKSMIAEIYKTSGVRASMPINEFVRQTAYHVYLLARFYAEDQDPRMNRHRQDFRLLSRNPELISLMPKN